jgi:hypothetical protein
MQFKKDFLFALFVLLLFLPFILSSDVLNYYKTFNHDHGMVTSFIKFAILATLGEIIGLRIKTGNYYETGFGILPRAIIWGFIGLTIKMAFIIFSSGTPVLLEYLGLKNALSVMKGSLSWNKVFVAFCTSVAMNIVYAPVMMTFHKITDTHIIDNDGRLNSLVTPIKFRKIFLNLNWDVQWNFVFKKTIPFFWIPAHTITFLLPPDYQVLFAALLGIALGTILAVANKMESQHINQKPKY